MRAAGVNPVDAKIRSGAAQQIFPTRLPAVLGLEVAGAIDEVGPGVDGSARQAAEGNLRVTVARTYPLEEAPAAHEVVESGHGRGRIVLLVG